MWQKCGKVGSIIGKKRLIKSKSALKANWAQSLYLSAFVWVFVGLCGIVKNHIC